MKAFKKINLVYLLQVFSVLLIFGYPVSSSDTKETISDKVSPPVINKKPAAKTNGELLLTAKINDLSIIYMGKSW